MLKKFRASKGKVLPVKVNKKLVFIKDNEDLEIDMSKVDYVTKVQLIRALDEKDIVEVGNKPENSKKEPIKNKRG